MPPPAAATYVLLPIFASCFGAILMDLLRDDPSEDPARVKYKIHPHDVLNAALTPLIDSFLLRERERVRMGPRHLVDGTSWVPGVGTHYYYPRDNPWWWPAPRALRLDYVGFEKRKVNDSGREYEFYVVFVRVLGSKSKLIDAVQGVLPAECLLAWSIDTSQEKPRLLPLPKYYSEARDNQRQAVQHILAAYDTSPAHNVKVCLCGPRGTGKTYAAALVAMNLQRAGGVAPMLFDDFNPSAIGVNIVEMALRHATPSRPVVLVINEIDRVYEQAVSGAPQHDPRLQYTRDRTTFHNMLDELDRYPNVIVVYTTERSPTQLWQAHEANPSFMRKGRVDQFIGMTADGATVMSHPKAK